MLLYLNFRVRRCQKMCKVGESFLRQGSNMRSWLQINSTSGSATYRPVFHVWSSHQVLCQNYICRETNFQNNRYSHTLWQQYSYFMLKADTVTWCSGPLWTADYTCVCTYLTNKKVTLLYFPSLSGTSRNFSDRQWGSHCFTRNEELWTHNSVRIVRVRPGLCICIDNAWTRVCRVDPVKLMSQWYFWVVDHRVQRPELELGESVSEESSSTESPIKKMPQQVFACI